MQLRASAGAIGDRNWDLLDAHVSLQLNRPELQLGIDRDRAADLDADTQSIAMRYAIDGRRRRTGIEVPRSERCNEDYDVQLRLRKDFATIAKPSRRLYVPSRRGKLVRLDNLVTLSTSQSVRGSTARSATSGEPSASVAPGYGLADRIEALIEPPDKFNMPPGLHERWQVAQKNWRRTFSEFLSHSSCPSFSCT